MTSLIRTPDGPGPCTVCHSAIPCTVTGRDLTTATSAMRTDALLAELRR